MTFSEHLTIAIPTYNRPEKLLRLVEALCLQVDSTISILVLDNHSTSPVEKTLAPLLVQYPNMNLQIVRHPANIGGNANILRCFELPKSKWVWIIGDDDLPCLGAVKTVLDTTEQFPNATVLNFSREIIGPHSESQDLIRDKIVVTSSIEEFSERLDSFGNFLFISANVYRRDAIVPWLLLGYLQMISCGPQAAMALAALQEDNGVCVFHFTPIVQCEPLSEDGWGYHHVARALPDIVNVVRDLKVRSVLAKKNAKDHPAKFLPPAREIACLIANDADCNLKVAVFAANYLSRARSNIVSSPASLRQVTLQLITCCIMLLWAPFLGACYRLYRWAKRSGESPDLQPLKSQIDEFMSDKRA